MSITLNNEQIFFHDNTDYEFGTLAAFLITRIFSHADKNETDFKIEVTLNGEIIDHKTIIKDLENKIKLIIDDKVNALLCDAVDNGLERQLKAEQQIKSMRESIEEATGILSPLTYDPRTDGE